MSQPAWQEEMQQLEELHESEKQTPGQYFKVFGVTSFLFVRDLL
jgi:hypothetical protein